MRETCHWNVSVYLLRIHCRSSESPLRRYCLEYGLSVVLATCLALSTIVDMITASCVESMRRYPMSTIYVSVYFRILVPFFRYGNRERFPRENEEASGPETLREGRVGTVGTFYSGSSNRACNTYWHICPRTVKTIFAAYGWFIQRRSHITSQKHKRGKERLIKRDKQERHTS